MRRLNSSLKVEYISEKGMDSVERTYFAYIPLENMVCYAAAESYDSDEDINSAKLAVESVLTAFERRPSFRNIKQYIQYAHDQIRANSAKNILEAAITVVVSDYTRIRYASCGNIKFFLLSDNAFYIKGETQTYYQHAVNEYGADSAEILENKNLLQYLGSERRPRAFISKKINLPEESTMLFATESLWERVDDIEILDAYGDSKPDKLLNNIQELYLSTQLKNSAINSYTLISIFVEKTFKEDISKKKKRRKAIIIVSIIILILLIIAATAVSAMRADDRHSITEIERLDSEGIIYSNYGDYMTSYEQYIKAYELSSKLKNNLQFTNEKKVLADNIEKKWRLFSYIINGDKYADSGNYNSALKAYKDAQKAYNEVYDKTDYYLLSNVLADKIVRIQKRTMLEDYVNMGEMYEIEELYEKALEYYTKAEDISKTMEDSDLRKEIMNHIYEVEVKMNNLVESNYIKQLKELMQKAEDNWDFNLALQYLEAVIKVYSDMGITDEQSELDKVRLETKIELDKKAAGYISDAADAESKSEHEDALRYYDMVLKLYREMDISFWHERYIKIENEIDKINKIITEEETKDIKAEEMEKHAENIKQLKELMKKAEESWDFELALQYIEDVIKIYSDMEITDEQSELEKVRLQTKIELDKIAAGYASSAEAAELKSEYEDALRSYEMVLKLYQEMDIGFWHERYVKIEDDIIRIKKIITEEKSTVQEKTLEIEGEETTRKEIINAAS